MFEDNDIYKESGVLDISDIIPIVEELPASRQFKNELVQGFSLIQADTENELNTNVLPYMYLERNGVNPPQNDSENTKGGGIPNYESIMLKKFLNNHFKIDFDLNEDECDELFDFSISEDKKNQANDLINQANKLFSNELHGGGVKYKFNDNFSEEYKICREYDTKDKIKKKKENGIGK